MGCPVSHFWSCDLDMKLRVLFSLLLVCVFVCVPTALFHVPEVSLWYLSLSLCTSLFQTGSLTQPGTSQFSLTD